MVSQKNARCDNDYGCRGRGYRNLDKCPWRAIDETFKIKDPVAQGVVLGGTGHAVGTGTAIELGKVQGAMGALAIGVTGIMYVIFAPLVAHIILGY